MFGPTIVFTFFRGSSSKSNVGFLVPSAHPCSRAVSGAGIPISRESNIS